jgi:hypothetical protein
MEYAYFHSYMEDKYKISVHASQGINVRLYLKNYYSKNEGDSSATVSANKCKALSSNSSTTQKRERERRKETKKERK